MNKENIISNLECIRDTFADNVLIDILNNAIDCIKDLKQQLEEKDKIINEILDLFGTDDCPNSIDWIDEKYSKQIKKICDCDNCRDDYKKCWIKYFKNEILDDKERKKE